MKIAINKFGQIGVWHFAVLFIIFAPFSAWLLRQNNLRMIELRNEVIAEDAESGNIDKLAPKIEILGNYVLNHMNTDMGAPLELPGTYNAAVEKIRKKVAASGSANSAVYAEAQSICEDPNVLLTVRAQCIQDYVTNHAAAGSDPEELEFPDKALYSYSFSSPAWSPDLAGISLLIAGLSLVTFAALFILKVSSIVIARDPLE